MENLGKSADVLQRRSEQYARALTQNSDF